MRREALFLLSVHSFCWWVTDGWVVGTEANERIGIREKEETMKAWFIERTRYEERSGTMSPAVNHQSSHRSPTAGKIEKDSIRNMPTPTLQGI